MRLLLPTRKRQHMNSVEPSLFQDIPRKLFIVTDIIGSENTARLWLFETVKEGKSAMNLSN